jgi:biopolymer transport protein ExbD
MIPFIDLLFMMTAFLLITAVWTSNGSLDANANVQGSNDGVVDPSPPPKTLHVYAGESAFRLAWKKGDVVLSESTIEKHRVDGAFPELADAVGKTWSTDGEHREPGDTKVDIAVLHTDDKMPFDEIAASMDAIYRTKRGVDIRGSRASIPAFSVTFSAR